MTHYEWEEGTIILPAASFSALRRKVAEAYNREQNRVYELALKAHEFISKQKAPDRNNPRKMEDLLNERMPEMRYLEENAAYTIMQHLYRRDEKGKPRLKKPLKKDFPSAKLACSRLLIGLHAHISFNSKTRQVTWVVNENNHAVEEAQAHPVAKAFFAQLKQVKWTRGSGGHFLYADEYMRDDDHHNPGGGSRISGHFGPLGKQAVCDETGIDPDTGRLVRRYRSRRR